MSLALTPPGGESTVSTLRAWYVNLPSESAMESGGSANLIVFHNKMRETLLSQYANSPILLSLINNFSFAVDPELVIDGWFQDVWDVSTASGYGLDVWGRIVGVNRVLKIPASGDLDYFGFLQGSGLPFDQGTFYTDTQNLENYILGDEAFRTLIMVKAFANISDCATPTYNAILRQLFAGRGNAWVMDTGGMIMRVAFDFALQPFEVAILTQSGAFVPPTGVLFDLFDASHPGGMFGFVTGENGLNQGYFYTGSDTPPRQPLDPNMGASPFMGFAEAGPGVFAALGEGQLTVQQPIS